MIVSIHVIKFEPNDLTGEIKVFISMNKYFFLQNILLLMLKLFACQYQGVLLSIH